MRTKIGNVVQTMTKPPSHVQRVLCKALLDMLKWPDLTPEEAQWVQQFAVRFIAQFNLMKSIPKEEPIDETAAA